MKHYKTKLCIRCAIINLQAAHLREEDHTMMDSSVCCSRNRLMKFQCKSV